MESSSNANDQTKTIQEGKAKIHHTKNVFYNPVQEFNRDLSIAVLSVFMENYKNQKLIDAQCKLLKKERSNNISDIEEPKIDLTILEALSATGLRSIRYAKEVPNITKVIANDISQQAVENIKANVAYNQVEDLVETSLEDACMLMYKHKLPWMRFAAVDLDPYGCPSIFLDSAVQSVADGGMLLVTATDMAVLAGNSPETCYSKYGAISLKTKCCHEMALRILLQCIEKHANRYSRYTTPLLSISADFYIRVFVQIHSGAIHCKKTTSKLSMVYHCVGCDSITLQPLGSFKSNPSESNPNQMKACLPAAPTVGAKCLNCNQSHHLGGPIWSGPIHDINFVSKVLAYVEDNPSLFNTSIRIQGVLSMVREELYDTPLYFTLDKMFGRVHLPTMSMMVMRSAILNAGFKVSYSHASKTSVKTDAPSRLMWDIVRTWQKSHPIKEEKLKADPVASFILSQEMQFEVDLTERADANPASRKNGRRRFQYNPEPFWGPGSRAAFNIGDETMSKSMKNQNKNANRKKRQLSPQKQDDNTSVLKKIHNETK